MKNIFDLVRIGSDILCKLENRMLFTFPTMHLYRPLYQKLKFAMTKKRHVGFPKTKY